MSKLKPCPFCGGEAHISKDDGYYTIRCSKCPADFGRYWFPSGNRKKDEMIKTWNRRTERTEE